MLSDRNYKDVPDMSAVIHSALDLHGNFPDSEKLSFHVFKDVARKHRVDVIFEFSDKITNKETQNLISTIQSQELKHVILIIENTITPPALATFKAGMYGLTVEFFYISDLQYDITKHSYVPFHVVCDKVTKDDLLDLYGCTLGQLPKILTTDPMCKWYGVQPGTIFMIIREGDGPKLPENQLPPGVENILKSGNIKIPSHISNPEVTFRVVCENYAKLKGEKKKKK